MSNKKNCIVVIPVYKTLDIHDKIAINRAIDMTPDIDKVFIMPESFVTDKSFSDFENLPVERFNDRFFAGILGYNRLMLTLNFYKRFIDYKYMLIHQTDAFLFKSDLQYWCDKNYDYIGAPWLSPHKLKKAILYSFLLNVCPWVYSHHKRRMIKHYNNVGNGGLSLRKIETFIRILESGNTQNILNTYLEKQVSKDSIYNEDVFWGLEGPRLYRKFRKPHWREAIYFSLEMYPSFGYNLMDQQLPFGCHAPFVHETEFWKDHLPFIKPEKMEPLTPRRLISPVE